MDTIRNIKVSQNHFIAAILIFSGIIFFFALVRQPIIDTDERVYLYLSENMTWYFTNYTTQNSYIDQALPQAIYSSPVFHHPPLIPFLIKIFSFVGYHNGAKLVNFIFYLSSIFLVFSITLRLSDLKGALLSLFLWLVCPIFNLEARLIHLDLPGTTFILSGIWLFLLSQTKTLNKVLLFLSAFSFSLAMLTKYTNPIFIIIPALLIFTDKELNKNLRLRIIYFCILFLGFIWWGYILIRFGTLFPKEFVDNVSVNNINPFLIGISEREWYDIWIYFLAICPLFILYIGWIPTCFLKILKNLKSSYELSDNTIKIGAINFSVISITVVSIIIIAISNNLWTFRHVMPIFPIIYITVGWLISSILDRQNKALNAYIIIFVFITFIIMVSSSFMTLKSTKNLKPYPVALSWVNLWHLAH